jgi:cation-transporting ATPase E
MVDTGDSPSGSSATVDIARPVTRPEGLTSDEVTARVARGETNATSDRTSRTLGEIARANIFTRFNAILAGLLFAILLTGHFQDGLFGIVLVTNAAIGIYQEWKAKRVLDRLAVLSAPRARVIREGGRNEVAVGEIVLDDLLELVAGDQVPADGIVRGCDGLEVDESLLTGESDAIVKNDGDRVLSGSIVLAGDGCMQTTAVGANAYARRLATEARRFTLVDSELHRGTNEILRLVTYALIPAAGLLAWSQIRAGHDWRSTVQGIVAGVVAMIPEGLVLLTSLAFMLAAVALARRQVLMQELPAVEGLARVDVVCVDKTGTITEGIIEFDRVVPLDGHDGDDGGAQPDVAAALGALAADEHGNATMRALAEAFGPPEGWVRESVAAFSSARKWSAVGFADHGTWVIGAPEVVAPAVADADAFAAQVSELASTGQRVLLLTSTDAALEGESLPRGLRARALVTFSERVRSDAADTFRYFAEQGVQLRVISGDNPLTVGAVARRAGIEGADRVFDARQLPDDEAALGGVLDEYTVFGRVTPQQKRAMVGALQSHGHVVAMTGDGVNDALALKDADIGIAMGSGAAATRAVAQIVLLDSRFGTMPGVVAEGRRVIANVERVSNLYITKTVYATIIAIVIGITGWPYPFLPRHLTIVSTLAIGVPSFFLALAPNSQRYVPGFLRRVARFTLPSGTIIAIGVLVAYAVLRHLDHLSLTQQRTCTTIVLLAASLWLLVVLARPFNAMRAILVASMTGLFVLALTVPILQDFYALDIPSSRAALTVTFIASVGIAVALEISVRLRWSIDVRPIADAVERASRS